MSKIIVDENYTKAARRENKKRPRMKVHGRSLLKNNPHAGKKLAKK